MRERLLDVEVHLILAWQCGRTHKIKMVKSEMYSHIPSNLVNVLF